MRMTQAHLNLKELCQYKTMLLGKRLSQGWTQDRVKLHLERGTLADLAEARYTFTVDASVEDIILINVSQLLSFYRLAQKDCNNLECRFQEYNLI